MSRMLISCHMNGCQTLAPVLWAVSSFYCLLYRSFGTGLHLLNQFLCFWSYPRNHHPCQYSIKCFLFPLLLPLFPLPLPLLSLLLPRFLYYFLCPPTVSCFPNCFLCFPHYFLCSPTISYFSYCFLFPHYFPFSLLFPVSLIISSSFPTASSLSLLHPPFPYTAPSIYSTASSVFSTASHTSIIFPLCFQSFRPYIQIFDSLLN